MNVDLDKLSDLQQQIENLRNQMIAEVRNNGLNHPKTLEISEELDRVLNVLIKLNIH